MSQDVHSYVDEVPVGEREQRVVSSGRTTDRVTRPWSPAQIIGSMCTETSLTAWGAEASRASFTAWAMS